MIHSAFPSVTIAIPALNEEDNIENVINSFRANTYQNIQAIVVADGGSTDKTVQIVKKIENLDSRVKLIHNPEKIQSIGLNKILNQTESDLFIRADAHTIYSNTYVEQCVNTIIKTNVYNVGGAQRFTYNNKVQAGIALASVSFFGSGGAKYRNPFHSGFVDTVYLGCFITSKLKSIDGYKPIAINEDFDVNFRLRQLKENAIYLSSDIVSLYYPRNSFLKLFWQYLKYGSFKELTNRYNKTSSIRSLLPPLSLLVLSLYTLYWLISANYKYLTILYSVIAVILLIDLGINFNKSNIKKDESILDIILIVFSAIFSICIQNLAFSIGFFKSKFGLIKD